MREILIVDIETTGFLGQGGSIVEIGIVALDVDSGNVRVVFDSLLRESILNANHRSGKLGWIFKNSSLTVEAVRAAPAAEGVLKEVQDILNQFPLGCTAFNKSFDFDFLKSRGITLPKELQCPMLLSTPHCKLPNQYKNGDYKWPKVEEAWEHFFPDVRYVEEHRGCDDAKHEALIVHKLYEMGVFKV